MWESPVWSLGWVDLLEKEMATHSSTLAWRIPGTEEHGRLQSMGWQRVGHNWETSLHFTRFEMMGGKGVWISGFPLSSLRMDLTKLGISTSWRPPDTGTWWSCLCGTSLLLECGLDPWLASNQWNATKEMESRWLHLHDNLRGSTHLAGVSHSDAAFKEATCFEFYSHEEMNSANNLGELRSRYLFCQGSDKRPVLADTFFVTLSDPKWTSKLSHAQMPDPDKQWGNEHMWF